MGLSPFFVQFAKSPPRCMITYAKKTHQRRFTAFFSVLGMYLHGLMIKNALGALQEGIPYRSIFVVFPAQKGGEDVNAQ